jgi:hypothetical protein
VTDPTPADCRALFHRQTEPPAARRAVRHYAAQARDHEAQGNPGTAAILDHAASAEYLDPQPGLGHSAGYPE